MARLTSPPEIAPGVRVRLLPGRVPGLLLENSSAHPLLVFGTEGEPFLRIGPRGVEANLHSRAWWDSGRASGRRSEARIDASAAPEWHRVAIAPRFSWIEPRIRARSTIGLGTGPDTAAWEVPMQIGGEQVRVQGKVNWKPAAPARTRNASDAAFLSGSNR
jgi:hypothetical protein